MYFSKSTSLILTTFIMVSASGCSEIYESAGEEYIEYTEQRLLDDNDQEYTLKNNKDGTETAIYDNGDSVTFKRDDDGNIAIISGMAGLCTGLLSGYMLFHGFSSPLYNWNSDTRRYTPSYPPRQLSWEEQNTRFNNMLDRMDRKDRATTGAGGSSAAANKNSSNNLANKNSSNQSSNSSNSSARYSNGSSSKSSSGSSSRLFGSSSSSSSARSFSGSSSAKGGFGSAGARSSAS